MWLFGFLVVQGCVKINIAVGVDHAHSIGRLSFHHVNLKPLPVVADDDGVSGSQTRVFPKRGLQHFLRVLDFVKKLRSVGPQLQVVPLGQVNVGDGDEVEFV
nr:hypothetical protein Iba_chr14aCG10970 [Ipomoea batatas]